MFPRQMRQRNLERQNSNSKRGQHCDQRAARAEPHHQQQRKQQRAANKSFVSRNSSQSLRAKWNSLGLKLECEFIQRSLAKLVRATKSKCLAQLGAAGQPAGPTRGKSAGANHLRRSQSLRPALAASSRQSSLNEATRSASCASNNPLGAANPQARPLSAFKRNEFSSRSLQNGPTSCKWARPSTKTLVSGFLQKSLCKPSAEPRPGKLTKLRSLAANSCGQSKRRQSAHPTSADRSSQTIGSLLSSAAASRHHAGRRQMAGVQKLLFAVGAALVLFLPLLLQLAAAAPISHFTRAIRPVWLADGLMSVSDSSPLDSQLEAEQTSIGGLIDRIQDNFELQQQLEQQQQQEQLKRSWFSLEKPRDGPKPASAQTSDETFWVERRRLDRDRALEPPAWLRDRPIRRDNSDAQRAHRLELEPADRPIRARFVRGRQLRQSSGELYDELLRHLIEETLEGRAVVEKIVDELESKRRLKQLQADSGAPVATYEQAERSAGEQDEATLRNSNTQPDAAGQGVIVAGDEISNDEHDIGLLEPTPRPQQQQQQQQQQRQDQPLLAVAQKLTKLPVEAPPGAAELVQLAPADSKALFATDEALSQTDALSLDELRQLGGSKISPAQAGLLLPAAEEETFHVIEDIDQADESRELSQTPPDASGDGKQDEPQVLQFVETPADWRASAWELLRGAPPSDKSKRAGRPAFGRGSPLDERQLDSDEFDDQPPFSSSLFAERDERSASRPLNKVALQSGLRNVSSAAAASAQPPLVTATELIKSGFFSRAQLIQFATKLRIYLENSLQLPRGAILGLFPINAKQLLVELDLNKLDSGHRRNLIDNFAYVRDSSSLLLNWPSGLDNRRPAAAGNPLPILIAILDKLHQDGGADSQQQQQQQTQPLANELETGAELEEPLERQRAQDDLATARSALSMEALALQPARRQPRPSAALYEQRAPTGQLVRQPRPQLQQLPEPAALLLAESEQIDEESPPGEPLELELEQASLLLSPAYGQQPLAPLAAYLRSVYGLPEPEDSPLAAALGQQRMQSLVRDQLIEKLALLRKQQLLASKTDAPAPGLLGRLLAAGRRKSAQWHESWGSFLLVLALALMSSCLIIKLLVRKFERRQAAGHKLCNFGDDESGRGRSQRRSFWWFRERRLSSSCSDHSAGATILGKTSQAGAGKQLGDAASLSADSGRGTSATLAAAAAAAAAGGEPTSGSRRALRNSLDSLTHRWAQLTGKKRAPSGPDLESAPVSKQAVNEADTQASEQPASKGGFRSSTSYIRSLVEAITRAATSQQMSTSTTQTSGRYESEEADDLALEPANEDHSSSSSTCLIRADGQRAQQTRKARAAKQQQQLDDSDGGQEVLMSQMDISAAHLILDYMEQHLIDKERLRREWLELNAASEPAGSGHEASSKQRAQRGSKAQQLVLQRLAKTALAGENRAKNRDPSVVPFDRNRVRLGLAGERQRSSGSSGASAAAASASASDYVNASFIYDDDPRRPTHIVAQGPTEHTCDHFWQMIWEQEIAVIVMLTRLNEDGQPMCHCYWPTDVGAQPAEGAGWAGRRGSVTSVLNCAHQQQAAGGPIVTSGEPNDNVLAFELPLGRGSLRLQVHLISEHVSSSDYLVRNMYLMNADTGETRTICQFHYLAWPAGRTPDNVRSFLQFRRKVHKSYRNLKSPILVHCSDGAGRSGTYTLIDMILERIKNGAKEIDLRASLEHLRDQRVGLCETQTQFEFVLVALAEEIQIILNALPQ